MRTNCTVGIKHKTHSGKQILTNEEEMASWIEGEKKNSKNYMND